jgi:hypothetical protein
MSSPLRRSLPLRGQPETTGPVAPKPFSQEWLSLPPERRSAPPRQRRRLPAPGWLPSERAVTIALVSLLILVSASMQTSTAPSVAGVAERDETGQVIGAGGGLPVATEESPTAEPTSAPAASTATTAATEVPPPTEIGLDQLILTSPTATKEPNEEAGDNPTAGMEGALLPKYRILAYYGHPHNENMGILGQFSKEELLAQLLDEARTYEAADPSRPVMPAFELIASVAQGDPQSDGSYLAHTDHETIWEYIEFTQEHDILLILDIQMGRTSVQDDFATVEEFLREPNVHLAIDPEFAMGPDEIPGQVIGGIDGADVTWAQKQLLAICEEYNLPPKVLIVHRFRPNMIRNDEKVKVMPGVQVVIDMDGFGTPDLKLETYRILITEKRPEFAGIKIFYDQDKPMMHAEDVLALDPPPDFIMFH